MQIVNLTEAKARLSSLVSRVAFAKEKIAIRRKGRNVVVMIPYEDFMEKWSEQEKGEGLLMAKNALADIEDLDGFVEDIYEARRKSIEREIKDF